MSLKRKTTHLSQEEAEKKRKIANVQDRWLRYAIREAYRELKYLLPQIDNIDKCMNCGRQCAFQEATQYILHLKTFVSPLETGILDSIFHNLRWKEQSLVLPETDNAIKRRELITVLKTTDYITFLQKAINTLTRNNVQWNELIEFSKYSRSKSRNRQFI